PAAARPLDGPPLEPVVVRPETNPAPAAGVPQDLVDRGVAAIAGGAASSVSLEVARVATPAGIPPISCCSTSDLLTTFNENSPDDAERYFFRTSPPDSLQSVVVAIAAEDLACTRLAILHLDDG